MRIINILEEIIKEIEKNNPYKLVLKGGTALSLFYLKHHRESEDLDFDTDVVNKKRFKEIEKYFMTILKKLKEKQILKDFKLGKSGLAATNRYHMKLILITYKEFQTKIDVDFVKLPKNLRQKNELYFYPIERIFITKMVTFVNRKEFKDLYDITYLLPKIKIETFIHNKNVINLLEDVIKTIEEENITQLYKYAFRNVDLRFKNLRASDLNNFISKLIKNLRKLKNRLR